MDLGDLVRVTKTRVTKLTCLEIGFFGALEKDSSFQFSITTSSRMTDPIHRLHFKIKIQIGSPSSKVDTTHNYLLTNLFLTLKLSFKIEF